MTFSQNPISCDEALPSAGRRTHANPAVLSNGSLPPELLEEYTESGRRRRKDQGAKRERTSKGWSEDEELRFLEALDLHGREWSKAAAHVGDGRPWST